MVTVMIGGTRECRFERKFLDVLIIKFNMDVDKAFIDTNSSRWQYQFDIRWAAHCKLHYGCANMQILFNENVILTITALDL